MKKIFFFFIALLFISIAQAQNIPVTNPNAVNLPVAKNLPVALYSPPSVTIVNEPGQPLYNQTWMQKNLNVTTYRNGDPIPEVKDSVEWSKLTTGAWCYYKNDPAYGKIYGKLYNWYAVYDPRGLAPAGWHIPSDVEWTALSNGLGGEGVAGGKMKVLGESYSSGKWSAPNEGATNSSGFSGWPGGYRLHDSRFSNVRLQGHWWSSTDFSLEEARSRQLNYYQSKIFRESKEKQDGLSVRCIKD